MDQRELRLARLQQQRQSTRPSADREHTHLHRPSPATGTKIATAGFAAASIFGMVTAMTWSQHAVAAKNSSTGSNTSSTEGTGSTGSTAAPVVTAAPKIVVRVHHVKAGTPIPSAIKPATPPTQRTKKPITLTPVQVKPAPVAVTCTSKCP